MKKINLAVCAVLLAVGALGGCNFLMGPDSPAGNSNGGGNLSVSLGTADNQRALTAGTDLPAHVLDALRYELVLTGPSGEVVARTASRGDNLVLAVALGEWRIDAEAYLQDGLAGSGTRTFTVAAGDNSVVVPMTINQGYFDIAVDPAIANGTVSPNFDAAFPGTTVTLTVTPAPGYVLKKGSLKYSDDSVITGPPYTFAMPGEDITVSAFFNRIVDTITVEGPQDEAVPVTAQHSRGNSSTDISWLDKEWVTFTVNKPGYTREAGNLMWFVDGEKKLGTGNYLTINARDYIKRKYNLTAMIKLNDQWYSSDASFRVVD
jgi:hypothetical protein